jgi:tetratricopeptide (TPR) repeat protein
VSKQASFLIHQARFFLKTNWLQAVKILEKGISEIPESFDLMIELGDIYHKHNVNKKSLEYYQRAAKFGINLDNIYLKIGFIYLDMKESKLALYYFDKIVEVTPDVLYCRAIAYDNLRENAKAISILKDCIKMGDKNPTTYIFLIEILKILGRQDEALDYFLKAKELFGPISELCYLGGELYISKKNYLLAYTELHKALPGFTDTSWIYHLLAICAQEIGLTQDALKHYRDVILKDIPNSVNYCYLLIDMLDSLDVVDPKQILSDLFWGFDQGAKDKLISLWDEVVTRGYDDDDTDD